MDSQNRKPPRTKPLVMIWAAEESQAKALGALLAGLPDFTVQTRVTETGQADLPLAESADAWIIALGSRWEETLRQITSRPAAQRAPAIVVGSNNDPVLMRRVMQAGARDFFVSPVPRTELLQSLRLILGETRTEPGGAAGSLTAVINAKGGSGASLIAVSLAHIAAKDRKMPVALLDLDLQFGALPLALDLEVRNSLLEALNPQHELDPLALQGYMAAHASGIHVLSAMGDQLPLPWQIPVEGLARLLAVAREAYRRVVVDLPRQIDPLTSIVLSQATHVVVVMQQSLAHVRDAKRMVGVLNDSLGVPRDRVELVVNRHSESDAVKLADIVETIHPASSSTLPNDFAAATGALNSGVPLPEHAAGSPLTAALRALADKLEGGAPEEETNGGARKRTFRDVIANPFARPRHAR